MVSKKTTDELRNEICEAKDMDKFLNSNSGEFSFDQIGERLCSLIKEKNMKKADVVARSGLNRIYAYQILAGKKKPSRDKLISFCFGLQLTLDETDKLLLFAGYSQLYARNKRDAIIIFAIQNKKSVFAANEMLYDNGFEIFTS